ncbi:hypothetical protein [Faecalibacterium taiwanense]|uniref:hypothetical protein n=1 Tax=Faecalibacterium taiwanense TaxID=3030638 RepID=UPI003219F379
MIFGIFFRRMQKNRSDQEKIVSSVKPGKRAAAQHPVQRPLLFYAVSIHSQHVLFSSSVCSSFSFAARISPANKKPTLTPRIKPTMPAANTIAPPPFFYHILPYIICRMQLQPVAKGKITAQRASFFAPERCKTLPHLLYF